MGNLMGLAGKVAPFFMPGVTPLMATMNAMGVDNPLLLSAIMQNNPGYGEAGPEWQQGARGEAARSALMGGIPYEEGGLAAAGYPSY